jgi:NDP-sugar pyrophosphorylase family protein
LIDKPVLERIASIERGSLERDVLERLPRSVIRAHQTDGKFLDIGTPESLAEAESFISSLRTL